MSLPDMAYESIDWSHPLMASATHAEYWEALEEAETLRVDTLSKVFAKRMDGKPIWSWLAPDENWMDFHQARFSNIRLATLVRDHAYLGHSALDVFQINTAGNVNAENGRALYIKSLIDDEFFGWFHAIQTRSGRLKMTKMMGLNRNNYPDFFPVNAVITPRKIAELCAWGNTIPVSPEDPMFQIARLF